MGIFFIFFFCYFLFSLVKPDRKAPILQSSSSARLMAVMLASFKEAMCLQNYICDKITFFIE